MTETVTRRRRIEHGVRQAQPSAPRRALTPDEVLRLVTPLDGGAHVEDRERLVQGTTLKCPSCTVRQDILAFWPLQLVERFQAQLAVVLRCRLCNHIFALNPGRGNDAEDV